LTNIEPQNFEVRFVSFFSFMIRTSLFINLRFVQILDIPNLTV